MLSVRYTLSPQHQLLLLGQTGFTFILQMFKVVKTSFAACCAPPSLILLLRGEQRPFMCQRHQRLCTQSLLSAQSTKHRGELQKCYVARFVINWYCSPWATSLSLKKHLSIEYRRLGGIGFKFPSDSTSTGLTNQNAKMWTRLIVTLYVHMYIHIGYPESGLP